MVLIFFVFIAYLQVLIANMIINIDIFPCYYNYGNLSFYEFMHSNGVLAGGRGGAVREKRVKKISLGGVKVASKFIGTLAT